MEVLEDVDLEQPLCQGQVFKQTRSKLGFNKRYFVLYPGFMLYYDSKSAYLDDLKGKRMRRYKKLNLNRVYLTKVERLPRHVKHAFVLHLPDSANRRHEMMIVVGTHDEKRQWMDCIQAQNPKLIPSESK